MYHRHKLLDLIKIVDYTFFKLVGMGTSTEEVLSAALIYMVKLSDNNRN
jgi:hypothetical protein